MQSKKIPSGPRAKTTLFLSIPTPNIQERFRMDSNGNSGPRAVIATQDPRMGGGVLPVTKFAYDTTRESGLEPHLMYNAHRWSDCLTSREIVTGQWDVPVTTESIDGMKGTRIGRILPELEITNYTLNHRHWRVRFEDAEMRLGVGGTCLTALPFALSGRQFGCWIGTTIEDERAVQRDDFGLLEGLRYGLTRPVLRRYERYVLEQAEKVLVQSEHTQQQIFLRHGISPNKVSVVPFPIDTGQYSPPPSDVDERAEIVFVGRIGDPRKNIGLLLQSFDTVLKAHPEAQLTLIGGELTDELSALVSDLGVSDSVQCLGSVPDVVPYLRRAAVFTLPSKQEGLGIAGLEAMSCGTPVVATRCGGPEDYVVDGQTGFLVPEGDIETFAVRLIKILSDPSLRSDLGQGARRRVMSEYAQADIRDQMVEILQSLRS